MKKKLVVLTGAGISAESGISTFRDAGGLWQGYDVMEVASPQGWIKNPELVLEFYNQRRQNVRNAQPNKAHLVLKELEKTYDVTIITQNVDDLHERAGSSKIVHLHGEILKVRSSVDPSLIYEAKGDIKLGDNCEKGSQLRPHIVWFGEAVPMIETAMKICEQTDILIVIGTSLVVYPANGLIGYIAYDKPKYLIDPNVPEVSEIPNLTIIQEKATIGTPKLVKQLLDS